MERECITSVLDSETVEAVLATFRGDHAGAVRALVDIVAHRTRRREICEPGTVYRVGGKSSSFAGATHNQKAQTLPVALSSSFLQTDLSTDQLATFLQAFVSDLASAWLKGPTTEEERRLAGGLLTTGSGDLLGFQQRPLAPNGQATLTSKTCKVD